MFSDSFIFGAKFRRIGLRAGHCRIGAAVIEVIVVLALIVTVLILAVGTVGLVTRESFGRVAISPTVATEGPRRNYVGFTRAPELYSFVDVLRDERQLKRWQWTGVSMSVVLNFVLWTLLFRRWRDERRLRIEQEAAEPATVDPDAIFQRRHELLRILSAHTRELLDGNLQVRHVMTTQIITVSPTAPLIEAADLMRRNHVRHLLVCTEVRRLSGLLTLADLRIVTANAVYQVMHRQPTTVTPNTPLIQALTTLLQERRTCLPVVSEGAVHGVLTTTDAVVVLQSVLQFLTKFDEHVRSAAETRPRTITELASRDHSPANLVPDSPAG